MSVALKKLNKHTSQDRQTGISEKEDDSESVIQRLEKLTEQKVRQQTLSVTLMLLLGMLTASGSFFSYLYSTILSPFFMFMYTDTFLEQKWLINEG